VQSKASLNGWLVLKAMDLVRWALDRSPERIHETADRARDTVRAYFDGALSLRKRADGA
jgi:hypothetical protein